MAILRDRTSTRTGTNDELRIRNSTERAVWLKTKNILSRRQMIKSLFPSLRDRQEPEGPDWLTNERAGGSGE